MIRFLFKNQKAVAKNLADIEKLIDVDRVVDAAAAAQLNRIRVRFLNQEDTEGQKWPESAAARRRAASGRGGGTLFDTGNLFHSIGIKREGAGVRSIGTNVSYAEKHQEGQEGLPKREFIGISTEDDRLMLAATEALIAQALRRRR
jgi:phage gpG-like protein